MKEFDLLTFLVVLVFGIIVSALIPYIELLYVDHLGKAIDADDKVKTQERFDSLRNVIVVILWISIVFSAISTTSSYLVFSSNDGVTKSNKK